MSSADACVVAAVAHHVVAESDVGHLGADVDGVGGVDRIEVVAEALPAPRDALVEGGTGNVLDALHQFDELVLRTGPDRGEPHPAVAHDDRGDAVPTAGGDLLVPADLAVVVGVDVDEAGRDEVATGVDLPVAGFGDAAVGCGDDGRDRAAPHRDVAGEGGSPGSVDDAGVSDDEISHWCTPSRFTASLVAGCGITKTPSRSTIGRR